MSACRSIVLTGAGGFLGSHLLPELLGTGHRVLAVTSRPEDEVRASLPGGVDSGLLGVIAPDALLNEAAARLSGAVVLSCAFPRGGDGAAMARGLDFIDRLLSRAAEEGARGFVNVSSQSVYPSMRATPAREGDALALEDSYAIAKRSVELLVRARCEGRIPYTSVRLASLVGPGFDQRVVNKMAKGALETGIVSVLRPKQVFDYMDVRDAASALAALAESDPMGWGEVYNLGSGDPRTLGEIAGVVADAVRAQGKPCDVYMTEDSSPAPSSALDASRFRTTFGWKPDYLLEDTVGDIVCAILCKETAL